MVGPRPCAVSLGPATMSGMTTDRLPPHPSGDLFRGLFDDASLFPPAELPMRAAVAAHVRHRAPGTAV